MTHPQSPEIKKHDKNCPLYDWVIDIGYSENIPKCECKSPEMPETIHVSLYETVATCVPSDYWQGGKWPAVFKQKRDRSTEYSRIVGADLRALRQAVVDLDSQVQTFVDAYEENCSGMLVQKIHADTIKAAREALQP